MTETQECDVTIADWHLGNMIHLKSVSHVANSTASILKLVAQKGDLMPPLNQALRQLISVSLHSSKLGKSEISTYQDVVLPLLITSVSMITFSRTRPRSQVEIFKSFSPL